jgi:hypothetical protein
VSSWKKLGLNWRRVGTVLAKADYDEHLDDLDNNLLPRLEEANAECRLIFRNWPLPWPAIRAQIVVGFG